MRTRLLEKKGKRRYMPVKPRMIIDVMWTAWSHLGVAGGRASCSGQWPSMNVFLKRPVVM